MNMKVKAILVQLEALSEIDVMMLSRAEIVELSNLCFGISGACEAELERRRGYATHVHELEGHH